MWGCCHFFGGPNQKSLPCSMAWTRLTAAQFTGSKTGFLQGVSAVDVPLLTKVVEEVKGNT